MSSRTKDAKETFSPKKDAMNNHIIGSRSGPFPLEVGTYWRCASTCDVPVHVPADGTNLTNPASCPTLHRILLVIILFVACALPRTVSAQAAVNPTLPGGSTGSQTNSTTIGDAILFDGIWYNPLFYPPPPAEPALPADAIAAALAHFQATNTAPMNAVSAPMTVVDAAAAGGLTPLSPQGQIRVDANNRAVADFGPQKVSWAADIADEGGTVDMFTPTGEELKSYIAGVYYLSADGQPSALIASLQSSSAQIVPPDQVLYPDAFVSAIQGASVSIDAIFRYDVNSLSQDLAIRKQLSPPGAFSSLANPNAPDLRLAVITVFPGITQQPTLVPTPVNLDDPTSAGTEPDTDIIFSGARMIAGHAFLTGDNPTPIPVFKSWQNIDQNWCLVESVPLSLIQNALGQHPPATASVNPSNNGGANPGNGAHGVTRPTPASSLAAR